MLHLIHLLKSRPLIIISNIDFMSQKLPNFSKPYKHMWARAFLGITTLSLSYITLSQGITYVGSVAYLSALGLIGLIRQTLLVKLCKFLLKRALTISSELFLQLPRCINDLILNFLGTFKSWTWLTMALQRNHLFGTENPSNHTLVIISNIEFDLWLVM